MSTRKDFDLFKTMAISRAKQILNNPNAKLCIDGLKEYFLNGDIEGAAEDLVDEYYYRYKFKKNNV